MITFFRYVKSDLIKIARLPMLLIHVIFPIFGTLAFLGLFAVRCTTPFSKISGFFELAAFAYPLLAAIVCSMAANEEASAGNFKEMMTAHIKFMPFLSKLTALLLLGAVAILILVIGFILGLHVSCISLGYYLYCACILFSVSIFFYVLNLIISLRFGTIQTIVAGILETFLGPFLTSGIFDGTWNPTACIVRTLIILIIAWIWFSKWEGRKGSDE